MTHGDLFKFLADIVTADGLSHGVVAVLTVLVTAVMRAMLPAKGLAVVFAPAVYFGGLAAVFAARHWGWVVSTDKAANVVATSVGGMTAALVLMVVLVRLVDALTRMRPLDRQAA